MAHVGFASQARLHDAHHLAHVASALGAEFGDDGLHFDRHLVGTHALGQVGLQDLYFRGLLVCEVDATALRECGDRVLALLYKLVDDRHHCGIVEHHALVDLFLLHGGEKRADGAQALGVLGAHGVLHVFSDLVSLGTVDRLCESGIEGNRHRHPQLWHLFLMRSQAVLPETFDHVASGSPEEEGLVFSFSWLTPDAPLDAFAEPYVRVIAKVRQRLALA